MVSAFINWFESEQKHRLHDTYYTNTYYTKVIKFMNITSNSIQSRLKTQKGQKSKKLVFQKDW